MGNPGVYGTRKFELLDYTGGVATAEIADDAVTTTKLSTVATKGLIVIQCSADSTSYTVPKPPYDITLTEARVLASMAGPTTGTAGSLTVDIVEASSGFGTTANIGTLTVTATTSTVLKQGTVGITDSIGSTQALIVVSGATTLVNDNYTVLIAYTKDDE